LGARTLAVKLAQVNRQAAAEKKNQHKLEFPNTGPDESFDANL
jgi:hypothetical protein